jgi:hypothetical protein
MPDDLFVRSADITVTHGWNSLYELVRLALVLQCPADLADTLGQVLFINFLPIPELRDQFLPSDYTVTLID